MELIDVLLRYFIAFLVVFFALPSIQVLFSAPINLLWRLKIGLTELGVFFSLILIVLSVLLLFVNGSKFIGSLGVIASFIYLIPLFKSSLRADKVSTDLQKAFGSVELSQKSVINFAKLLGFYSSPDIHASVFYYSALKIETQSIDIYSDKSGKPKPCIISVHGGAWSSGDNKMFVNFNKDMASRGYLVADVNYRLAPNDIFPAQKDDVILAIDYLEKNASELEIDTNQLFLLGRSAGGQIAAVTAFELGKAKIKGLITFYTPHDMVWGYSYPGNPWILDSRHVLREYLGGDFDQAKTNFYASSPVHQVNENIPPILMVHGESDEMVAYEHNLRLIEKIKPINVPHYLLSIPMATHGCDFFHQSHSAQISTYAVNYFLKRYSN